MKKNLSLIMVTVFAIGILSACGHADEKENDTSVSQIVETESTGAELVTTEPEGEITISELINQRVKEKGKIEFYRIVDSDIENSYLTQNSKVSVYSYDGNVMESYINPDDFLKETRFGDIINNKVDYSTYVINVYGASIEHDSNEKYIADENHVQMEITTDDSTNNTQLETMCSYSKGIFYTRDNESEVWNQTETEENYPVLSFGTFERIKLDGKTYMTFCVKDELDLIEYVIIPDNKFTENKTVVYDTPGTEGISVNTIDYLKKYQAVSKEELEQTIVSSESKKEESSKTAK
ncbi:hypothetical protein [Agathobacter sp.]